MPPYLPTSTNLWQVRGEPAGVWPPVVLVVYSGVT